MQRSLSLFLRFETCGLTILSFLVPSYSDSYDSNFFNRVTGCVKEIFEICISDNNGVSSANPSYDEVASVCANLPLDKSGISLSYEHIRFGGPSLWKVLHKLFTKFFADMGVPTLLKTTLILPLFKGKEIIRGISLCSQHYAKSTKLFY